MSKPSQTELVPAESPPSVPAVATHLNANDLIAKVIEANPDPAAVTAFMDKLVELRDREEATRQKKAFDDALAAFQADCPVVDKPKGVPTRSGGMGYYYAPLDYIIKIIKPCMEKHGLHHTLDTDVESKDGWVIAKCHVTHREGHTRTSTAKFPLGSKTAIMSDTQQYAAALTFASRRVFCNALGIVPQGEDLDGQANKTKPQGPSSMDPAEAKLKELAAELWGLLKPVRGTERNWNRANHWLWKMEVLDPGAEECAPDLSAKRFQKAIDDVKALEKEGRVV